MDARDDVWICLRLFDMGDGITNTEKYFAVAGRKNPSQPNMVEKKTRRITKTD